MIPLADETGSYWFVTGEDSGSCVWSDKPMNLKLVEDGGDIYGASIYTQRFLSKWVYRGEE